MAKYQCPTYHGSRTEATENEINKCMVRLYLIFKKDYLQDTMETINTSAPALCGPSTSMILQTSTQIRKVRDNSILSGSNRNSNLCDGWH